MKENPNPLKTPNKVKSTLKEIDYKDELLRKGIHLCSLSIPIIYYYIPRSDAIYILSGFLLFSLFIELLRYASSSFASHFYKFFGPLMRKHEMASGKHNLNGATYVFMASVVGVIVFPKLIFLTAFSILIISDTFAALIGRKYGKLKVGTSSKSWVGTFAFFLSGCMVVLIAPKSEYLPLEYMIGFAAAAVGAIGEVISYGWADDNLMVPLFTGFAMWAGYMWLLPGVSLILSGVPN